MNNSYIFALSLMKCTWRNKVSGVLQPKEATMTNMTFTSDVSSPLSTGVFSGADVCLRSHLSRAVGW